MDSFNRSTACPRKAGGQDHISLALQYLVKNGTDNRVGDQEQDRRLYQGVVRHRHSSVNLIIEHRLISGENAKLAVASTNDFTGVPGESSNLTHPKTAHATNGAPTPNMGRGLVESRKWPALSDLRIDWAKAFVAVQQSFTRD